jgi:hypothetical protein
LPTIQLHYAYSVSYRNRLGLCCHVNGADRKFSGGWRADVFLLLRCTAFFGFLFGIIIQPEKTAFAENQC